MGIEIGSDVADARKFRTFEDFFPKIAVMISDGELSFNPASRGRSTQ